MRTISARLLAIFMLTTSFSAGARAAPPELSAVTDEARQLHTRGDALYEKGDYEHARAAYLGAWGLKKHWQLAASLGDCEIRLKQYRDAAEHLAYFLRERPGNEAQRARYENVQPRAVELFEEARKRVGTLNVSADLIGAEVVVDGNPVGKAPLEGPVFVEPGRHTIEARLGSKIANVVSNVAAGEARDVALHLKGPVVPLVIAGGVVGGATLVVGGVLMGLAEKKAGDANAQLAQIRQAGTVCSKPPQAGPCADLRSTNASADTLHNAAIPLMVIGGLVAAGTLTYALWPRASEERAAPIKPILMAGSTGGGLWLTGEF